MAAATLAMTVSTASLVKTANGVTELVLVLKSTATASAVPLSVASRAVSQSDPQDAKAMAGTALTLNYDDATGVITSLT